MLSARDPFWASITYRCLSPPSARGKDTAATASRFGTFCRKATTMMWNKTETTAGQPAFVERRRWPRISEAPICGKTTDVPELVSLPFSTSHEAPSQQFPVWQKHMAPLIDAYLPESGRAGEGFAASQTVWNLEGRFSSSSKRQPSAMNALRRNYASAP